MGNRRSRSPRHNTTLPVSIVHVESRDANDQVPAVSTPHSEPHCKQSAADNPLSILSVFSGPLRPDGIPEFANDICKCTVTSIDTEIDIDNYDVVNDYYWPIVEKRV